jgi:hypothetical protein
MHFEFEPDRFEFEFLPMATKNRVRYIGRYVLPCGHVLKIDRTIDTIILPVDDSRYEQAVRSQTKHRLIFKAQEEARRLTGHRAMKWASHYAGIKPSLDAGPPSPQFGQCQSDPEASSQS